jgi:hypothetical protein
MILYPGISLYNQERQTDDHFVEAFVARHEQLDLLLNILRRQARGGGTPHRFARGELA